MARSQIVKNQEHFAPGILDQAEHERVGRAGQFTASTKHTRSLKITRETAAHVLA